MGKTLKLIICGKKAIGKTSILEQLIYNNLNLSATQANNNLTSTLPKKQNEKYIATIEDIYVACWEKDKGVKEKLRFYDTKGMDSAKDQDTINQIRHLFPSMDGAILVFSSADADSIQCVEKLKHEIEKSKDKKEICHFIMIDNQANPDPTGTGVIGNRELIRQELQSKHRCAVYELTGLDKRDLLCKPFIDLATNITQVNAKSSMNLVQSIKKPKVFSSK